MRGMVAFTEINQFNLECVIPFYYHTLKLGISRDIQYIFNQKEVYQQIIALRLSIKTHFVEQTKANTLKAFLKISDSFLYISPNYLLAKDPLPIFKTALMYSDVVFYENNSNFSFWAANYTENFCKYYPQNMQEYELFLQKNEGSFYTLPSCGLTTTKSLVDYELNTNSQALPAQATVA
jgi:hypothetical protein